MKCATLILTVLLAPLLSACSDTSLDARLAGLSGGERERETYWACLERSRDNAATRSQRRRLRAICEDAHEINLAGAPREERRVTLARECGNHIRAGFQRSPDRMIHFEYVKDICEELTGKPVHVSLDVGKPGV